MPSSRLYRFIQRKSKLDVPSAYVDSQAHLKYFEAVKYKVNIKLGKRIKKIRKEQKISQEELAHKAGIHRTYMGKIERGESNPPMQTVNKIASALKISLKDLMQ
jgi:DNA-binding XRE family transcriptional regulator